MVSLYCQGVQVKESPNYGAFSSMSRNSCESIVSIKTRQRSKSKAIVELPSCDGDYCTMQSLEMGVSER